MEAVHDEPFWLSMAMSLVRGLAAVAACREWHMWKASRCSYSRLSVWFALFVLSIAMVLTGCAGLSPSGPGEFRAGLFLHRNPNFSFRIPDNWRQAWSTDWLSFAANSRAVQRMNESGKAAFQRAGEAEIPRYAAVLISSRGSWIDVAVAPNRGTQFRSGYTFSDAERRALWELVEREMVRAAALTDKPKFTLRTMEVRDYGPNTVLFLELDREDLRGVTVWTALGLFSTGHVVTVSHATVPEVPSDAAEALDAIGRSFRFE